MSASIEEIAGQIIDRAGSVKRFMVGIAGPPGAGKSTLADNLAKALKARGESVEVLPLDGFHMDNEILIARGQLARKGIPETFDVRAFIDIMKAVSPGDQEVLVPVFDRSRELAIASARVVAPDHKFIIIEGNYVLFSQGKWAELEGMFDFTIMMAPPMEVLEERLLARWRGYDMPEDVVHAKTYDNDLPNGRRILDNRRPADITVDVAD